jgi:predicted regulator of Ras-like GTPase activity (Roadblock/LC7/MglB family)
MNLRDFFDPDFVDLSQHKVQELVASDLSFKAAVLATVDGFSVASAVADGADPDRIAALASSIASIGSVATQEAGLGRCSSVILNTEQGFAVVRQFQKNHTDVVLILVADGQVLLAQVMYRANELAKELVAA